MSLKRMIEFEATSDEAAERVANAIRAAFAALTKAMPQGVRLAYWRERNGRGFTALIELADENVNPLLDIEPVRVLLTIIGECVRDGYPKPQPVDVLGSYGFELL